MENLYVIEDKEKQKNRHKAIGSFLVTKVLGETVIGPITDIKKDFIGVIYSNVYGYCMTGQKIKKSIYGGIIMIFFLKADNIIVILWCITIAIVKRFKIFLAK